MLTTGKLGVLSAAFVLLALVGLLFLRGSPATLSSAGGLLNPGFEDGVQDGLPIGWDVVELSDAAVVVDQEGPAEFATYADQGITVDPLIGNLMLRLGSPKQISQKQPRGGNTVSQTFLPDRATLRFAFRLFSWEHRGDDLLRFDLKDGTAPNTVFEVRDADTGGPLVITMPDGTPLSCSQTPCEFTIDVGKQGQFLDSGRVKVEIVNVPVGQDLTLTYSVVGGENKAHATWGYFDNVNTPPVAKFSLLPLDPVEVDDMPRFEGSVVQLVDDSFDADGPGDIVSWQWRVTGPGIDGEQTTQSQNAFFIPPNQGAYVVELTVTDTDGQSDTVVSGVGGADGVASDGTVVPALTVENAPPMVNALNVEVRASEDISLIGRFLDAGWLDTHTAELEVGNVEQTADTTLLSGAVEEDHTAALGTGRVTATLPAGALGEGAGAGDEAGGVLRVSDEDGGFSDDMFAIAVIADDPQRHEGTGHENDTVAGAVTLTTDSVNLSYVQDDVDVDIFNVKWPGAAEGDPESPVPLGPQPLPPGAEVLVTLRGEEVDGNLPADYDLIILTKQPPLAPFSLSPFSLSPFSLSPFSLSPFSLSPFSLSPYSMSPFSLSPYSLSPFSLSPFSLSPFSLSPYSLSPFSLSPFSLSPFSLSPYSLSPFSLSPFSLSPFSLSPYSLSPFSLSPYSLSPFSLSPLSGMAFTGLEGDEISGTDIDFSELGLEEVISGEVRVAGFSANRGLEPETVLLRVDVPGTEVYAVVVGANDAHSLQPYALQLEASMPFDEAALGTTNPHFALCGSRTLSSGVGPDYGLPYSASSTPTTLFVTQAERLGVTDQDFWNTLKDLADHPLTNGKVISVDGSGSASAYPAWDADPCSIEAANAVADQVRTAILDELSAHPSIQYVVLLGSDDVVAHRRVPDETAISNERYYLISSFLEPGTPLFSSVRQGYNLSDDFYVDLDPTAWQGRALFIPDLPLGRLVETPQEIAAAAQAFIDSNGQLDPVTAFVSGYDFFEDGALEMADALGASLSLDTDGDGFDDNLIDGSWSADQLRCQFLGEGAGCEANVSDVNAVNAHFTHYAALSAGGFNAVGGLDQSDFFTSAEVAGAGGGSALATRIAYTMGCHAGLNVPAGSAFTADPGLGIDPELDFVQAMAVQRAIYVASTGYGLGDTVGTGGTERLLLNFSQELVTPGMTVGQALLEAKQRYLSSLSPMTVYDEKSAIQTTLYGLPHYQVLPHDEVMTAASAASAPAAVTTLELLPDSFTLTPAFTREEPAAGDYFTADGDSQSTASRPIQPRVVFEDITPPSADPVHGALITGGSFTDEEDFDPVIARPTIEWEENPPEPQVCLPSFWPSELATINTLETAGSLLQTLVVIPGQFLCDGLVDVDPGPGEELQVRGTQRLYDNLGFELLRSASDDFDPPVVTSLDLASANSVDVTFSASDPSGIVRIVVLLITAGGEVTVVADVTPADPFAGTFTVNIPDPGDDDSLVLHPVDGAGNVATVTGKGANLSVIEVDAGIDQAVRSDPVTGEMPAWTTVTFQATVSGFAELVPDVSYLWEFGDGHFASGQVTPDDPEILEFRQDGEGNVTFFVQHAYESPESLPVTATLKVTDAGGGVGVDSTQLMPCSDPSGDAGSVDRPDADLVFCHVTNNGTEMTITLVAGAGIDIDPTGDWHDADVQYRVRLDAGTFEVVAGQKMLVSEEPDGNMDSHLRYLRGQYTGLDSLTVAVTGDAIEYSFNLGELGRCTGGTVLWRSETQTGLPGQPHVGIHDDMPDSGTFAYVFTAAGGGGSGNSPPCAALDTAVTNEDTAVTIDVLTNDSDPDADPLAITGVTHGTSGSVTDNPDGSVTYEPNLDFNGTGSFTYTVGDGQGGTDTATVVVAVDPVNDAPTFVAGADIVVEEDSGLYSAVWATSISAGPDDEAGQALTFAVTGNTNPALFDVEPPAIAADGTLIFTPALDANGSADVTVELSDDGGTANGGLDTGAPETFTIAVTAVDDGAPVADDDIATTPEDTPLTIAVLDLLGNDTLTDEATFTGFDATGTMGGTVTDNSDGTLTYTPPPDFNGNDTFTYTVTDADGDTATGTATITVSPVNDPPVPADDDYSTDEDTTLAVNADQGVLANDDDVDGDALTASLLGGPANGILILNADGSFTYTPNLNFNGTDSFTYTVSDPSAATDSATVTITVNSVNDPPTATDDDGTTRRNKAVTIDVLANDTDQDGHPITVIGVTTPTPANGTVTINIDGTLTYTPDKNFTGNDSFTYTISDGQGGTATATVTVTVG